MNETPSKHEIKMKLADQCWVALALLHREKPEKASFTAVDIASRLQAGGMHPEFKASSVQAHIYQHLVANRPRQTGGYRMFYRLSDGTFRLFRQGDDADPSRRGKVTPIPSHLPDCYLPLLDWYEQEYSQPAGSREAEEDPLLSLRGAGKGLWAGEDPVEYVRSLRRGWYPDPDDASRQHPGAPSPNNVGERSDWNRR